MKTKKRKVKGKNSHRIKANVVRSNFTGYYDDARKPIFVGDKLRSKYDYEVIVKKDKDGDYYGKLVCDKKHSCRNIPYGLNEGRGHRKII